MRKFIQFFILAISFSFLASCGGGGGDLPGASGSKESLKAAYYKIKKGMSPQQVMGIVGGEPSHIYRYNGQIYALAYWTGTSAGQDYATLSINFNSLTGTNKGVYGKTYTSIGDSASQLYTD